MASGRQNTIRYDEPRLAYRDEAPGRGRVDASLVMLTLLLLTVGVIMVLSSSYANAYYVRQNATYYFIRQALFAAGGIGVMFICSRFPMGVYRWLAKYLFWGSVAGLVAVLVFGSVGGNARRWIDLGFTTFQPSELVKVTVVLFFAAEICKKGPKMRTFFEGIVPFVIYLGIIAVLLAMEPHYSAIIIILFIGLVMLFVGGVKLGWFVAGGIGGVGLMALAYRFVGYVQERVLAWRDPFAVSSDTGYQIIQSLYAIGSGGLLGLGLGNSRQKFLYLPEEHNDYIFSVVCEELGFIGAVLILALFALLILRGYWIALHAKDKYSMLVAVGITTQLALQVLMNIAVCTNAIPCTGISLPFFSYGGTALLLQLAEIGILMSISRDIPEKA